jgi:hypothetical protein
MFSYKSLCGSFLLNVQNGAFRRAYPFAAAPGGLDAFCGLLTEVVYLLLRLGKSKLDLTGSKQQTLLLFNKPTKSHVSDSEIAQIRAFCQSMI